VWVLVVNPNVIVDDFDQITDAAECPAADSFACDVGKPALDLIDLRRTVRREVHVLARSGGQPTLHSRMFLSAVIVQDQVDFQVRLNGLVDPVEKSQIRHQIPDAKTRRVSVIKTPAASRINSFGLMRKRLASE
jgi:hypothetical protein